MLHVECPIHWHCNVQRHYVANVEPVVTQRAQQRRLFFVVVVVVVVDDNFVTIVLFSVVRVIVVVAPVNSVILFPVVLTVRRVVLVHKAVGARRESNKCRKRKAGAEDERQLEAKRLSQHGSYEFAYQFADVEHKVQNRERLTQCSRLCVLIANKDLLFFLYKMFIGQTIENKENNEKKRFFKKRK